MALIPIRMKIVLDPDPGKYSRKFVPLKKEAYEAAAWRWYLKFLPRHFTARAISRYGYKPRTARYRRYKQKTGRGDDPILFAGLARERLLGVRPLVKAFPTRATMEMNAPRYVLMRPNTSKHPALGEELTRTTEDERRDLAGEMQRVVERGLARMGETRTVTIQ